MTAPLSFRLDGKRAVIDRPYSLQSGEREDLCFGHDFFDLSDEMGVARKEKNLVCGAQFADRFEGSAAAARIEIDENIVENHRQWIHMIGVFTNQSEAHGQVQLLGGAAAEELRDQADAVGAPDLNLAAIQRRG